jgi:hypothetical protein
VGCCATAAQPKTVLTSRDNPQILMSQKYRLMQGDVKLEVSKSRQAKIKKGA